MCLFCIINLVFILKAKFKAQHKSNFFVNIFIVYFLVVLFTFIHIPEIKSLFITIFESLYDESENHDLINIVEMMFDLLQRLTLFFEQLYVYWFTLKFKKLKTAEN